jgi:DNA-binding beta-propeller fold protein YncE
MKRAVLVGICLLCLGGMSRAQQDSLQDKILIAAITYDDGFGVALKDPAGIWYDASSGEVLVADAGNGRVVIYDSLLTATFSFRHFFKDPVTRVSSLGEPRGLAVNHQGEILLLDGRSDKLDLLDFRGRVLASVSPKRLLGDTTLRLINSAVTIDDHDNFYVVVTGGATKVLVIDRDLNLVRQMGEKGIQPSQLNTPVTIAVHDGKMYIGDLYGLPAVKIFDTLGNFLTGFGGHDVEKADLSLPAGIGFVNGQSTGFLVLALDGLRQTVKVFDSTGECVSMIGGFGYLPGLLQYPSGLASNGKTAFYVVEKTGGRVQRYEIK